MTISDKIGNENLQYDNRETAKTSALASGKINKYEYFVWETYCLLIKAELQNKLNLLFLLQKKLLKNKRN